MIKFIETTKEYFKAPTTLYVFRPETLRNEKLKIFPQLVKLTRYNDYYDFTYFTTKTLEEGLSRLNSLTHTFEELDSLISFIKNNFTNVTKSELPGAVLFSFRSKNTQFKLHLHIKNNDASLFIDLDDSITRKLPLSSYKLDYYKNNVKSIDDNKFESLTKAWLLKNKDFDYLSAIDSNDKAKQNKIKNREIFFKNLVGTEKPNWNGKVYGTKGKYNIYINNKKYDISDEDAKNIIT